MKDAECCAGATLIEPFTPTPTVRTWHAGLAAVPATAKLLSAEIGYILEPTGTRMCFVSPGLDTESAPFAPKSLI